MMSSGSFVARVGEASFIPSSQLQPSTYWFEPDTNIGVLVILSYRLELPGLILSLREEYYRLSSRLKAVTPSPVAQALDR